MLQDANKSIILLKNITVLNITGSITITAIIQVIITMMTNARHRRCSGSKFSPRPCVSTSGLCAAAGHGRECSSMIAVSRLATSSEGDTAQDKVHDFGKIELLSFSAKFCNMF